MHYFNNNHHYVNVDDQKLIESFTQVLIHKVARQAVHSASSNSLTACVLHLLIVKKYDLSVH